MGSLYHINCDESKKENKERLWHCRYGHLGEKSLKKLASKGLVDSFDYDFLRRSVSVKLVLAESITEVSFRVLGYMFKRTT